MTEDEFNEVERVLLAIGDAATRTAKARERVAGARSRPQVTAALDAAHQALGRVYRDLTQATYYAIEPDPGEPGTPNTLQSAS